VVVGVSSPIDVSRLEQHVLRELTARGVAGAAVGLRMGDQEFLGGFGVTNVAHPMAVDADTIFPIASLTKPITGTAVMRLIESGAIELEAPVRLYIPELSLADETAARTLTVRHLATHSSGWGKEALGQFGRGKDALAVFAAALHKLSQRTPVGSAWSYSNYHVTLLARIIEIVTGESYEDAIVKLVLDPIGMSDTYFFRADVFGRVVAAAHDMDADGPRPVPSQRAFPEGRVFLPAGGFLSTARDLMRFAGFHMGEGIVGKVQLLRPESLALMRSRLGPEGTHGLTWFHEDFVGRPLAEGLGIGHVGVERGYLSELVLVPSRQFAVVVLSNGGLAPDQLFPYVVANRFARGGPLGVTQWAIENVLGLQSPRATACVPTIAELDSFVGSYDGIRPVRVTRNGDALALEAQQLDGVWAAPMRLVLLDLDHFEIADGPAAGILGRAVRREEGRVIWLRLAAWLHVRTS
jgi:CubicO group peptidase (beta-lactamase class C family)